MTEQQQDLDLENIVGNLLTAQCQVDKLRTRLLNTDKKESMHMFKHNGKWCRIWIDVKFYNKEMEEEDNARTTT